MQKTIEISVTLYERLGQLAQTFETPQDVITRLLDSYEMKEIDSGSVEPKITTIGKIVSQNVRKYNKLDINFFPSDILQFKSLLLKKKQAWILLHMNDGSKNLHQWNASRFSDNSDVLGNLRSGYLRGWREKGIICADIAINKTDID